RLVEVITVSPVQASALALAISFILLSPILLVVTIFHHKLEPKIVSRLRESGIAESAEVTLIPIPKPNNERPHFGMRKNTWSVSRIVLVTIGQTQIAFSSAFFRTISPCSLSTNMTMLPTLTRSLFLTSLVRVTRKLGW